ncbi:MAG TPA: prepilin-type N-terminal cleavage/methylation domain-containing protein, partial [Gemmatimonadaceae bacterium]|nr:prepilin-type N-terminal cleavage/methylation domain-containing protein [Gemmatimonadaceae bacterium]
MRTSGFFRREGVTLIEMMIAIVLFVLVFGLAVPFFRYQARSVSASAGRLDALQNARYAQNAIDRDLRISGIGIVQAQPMIVQADGFAITFNADLATKDINDPLSIYYDADIDSSGTDAMLNSSKVTLPNSAVQYPDSNYMNGGVSSPAETISYWLTKDSTSGRPDQYILFRRVNTLPQKVVAKGIIVPAGTNFFQYMRPNALGGLDSIRAANLPLFHSAPIHGSPADTGASALTDSIRVIRMTVTGLYNDPDKGAIMKTVVSSTKLLNAGMSRSSVCGDKPIAVTTATAAVTANSGFPLFQPTTVTISWNSSLDQDAGEKDVERYMIFKKLTSSADWGNPIADIAASQTNYTVDDNSLTSGTWKYGVVAQDCSPANSSVTSTGAINV